MKWQQLLMEKINAQKALVDKAEGEKRPLTQEETDTYNELQGEIQQLKNTIEIHNAVMADLKSAAAVPPAQDEGGAKAVTVDSEEYKNAWLRFTSDPTNAVRNPEIMSVIDAVNPATLSNASSSGTGQFVPTTIANDILSFMLKNHPILSDVLTMHVKGNFVMNIHTGILANDAQSIPVGNCLEPEENSFVSVTLAGYQYGKLVEIPWAMRTMNITAWESYLTREVAARLGAKLANDVFYGRGNSALELTGISPTLKTTDAPQAGTYTALAYEDLTEGMAAISLVEGAKYVYCNEKTGWAEFANMLDNMGRPILISDPATGRIRTTFGVEIKYDSAVKDGDIFFGVPNPGYIINFNQGIATVTDDEPKCLKTNVVGWCVVDGTVVTTKAWRLLERS